jgi:PAS domain S-box-containing protein
MSTRKKQRSQQRPPSRKRAEKIAQTSRLDITKMKYEDVLRLAGELEIHQIELQRQNQQLRDAQIDLEESRNRYFNLYDFAPIGYVTLDQDGTILEANLTAAEMFGVERQALLGADLSKFVSPESQDRWFLHRRAAFSGGTKQVCEIDVRRADATRLAVRLEGIAFGPEKDRQCRTALIDLTERKDTEGALNELNRTLEQRVEGLRESEQRFRQMADSAPVMIWMSGADKLCTWFNRPWLEFTGRTMEQELGNGWSDGVHREDLAQCLETYVMSFDGHVPFTMEYRLRRHDGEWRWLLDNSIPLYQENGAFAGYIGSCVDVTDRKQSEDVLREREGRLQAILNAAADAIITTDRQGIIVSSNPATERIFGYTQEELLGQNVKVLMPQPFRDEHDANLASYQATGKPDIPKMPRETVMLRKDGLAFPVELTATRIPRLGLFTAIYRDISVRKQTEQELDQYRKDLRTLASEVVLAEERERQRLAEDLHDGVGQTLFRARMKLDQLSIAEPDAREIRTILEEMGRMVNTMTFELSPPVLRTVGFRAAVKSLAKDIQKRYALSTEIDDDGQDLALDERVALTLFRSVRELLINAAKHSQTNRASLSLRRGDRSVQIEIEDRGKGFDLADQSHHVESGHFGLFSVRERMEYVGGTFKIRSAPGHGAKVTLTAPLATANAAAAQ